MHPNPNPTTIDNPRQDEIVVVIGRAWTGAPASGNAPLRLVGQTEDTPSPHRTRRDFG